MASPWPDFRRASVALDNNGNLYLAELYLRKISSTGVLSTIAKISGIQGIPFDQAGNLYIADSGNSRIRKIDAHNNVTTIAGTGVGGFSGDGGPAVAAQLNQPSDVVVDAAGNVYIADRSNNRIRRITPDGTIGTFAGNGTAGSAGDNGSAGAAQLITRPDSRSIQQATSMSVNLSATACAASPPPLPAHPFRPSPEPAPVASSAITDWPSTPNSMDPGVSRSTAQETSMSPTAVPASESAK